MRKSIYLNKNDGTIFSVVEGDVEFDYKIRDSLREGNIENLKFDKILKYLSYEYHNISLENHYNYSQYVRYGEPIIKSPIESTLGCYKILVGIKRLIKEELTKSSDIESELSLASHWFADRFIIIQFLINNFKKLNYDKIF